MRRGGTVQQIIGIQRKKNLRFGRAAGRNRGFCSDAVASKKFARSLVTARSSYCEIQSGTRSSYSDELLPRVVVAAEEFVPLDGGDDADGAFVAGLRPLDAAEAAHAYRTSQGDFVGQGQKNFDGRAFPYIFGKKEVDAARTDVAGFGAGLANRSARGPADGQRKPHLKALSSAAF